MVGLALVNDTEGAALLTDNPSARLSAAEAIATEAGAEHALLGAVDDAATLSARWTEGSLAPNHPTARLALGTALMCSKRAAQAIAEFECGFR